MTQSQALSILKTGVNIFLTGEPGSGKTHTINEYVAYLRARGVEPAITASTGIAATHIGGMTIHSWSGIGIKTKLDKYDLDKISSSKYIATRIRRTKVLIIDEVSMLSPETFSMIDAVCREIKQNLEPFGGIQIVLVGDFFQLPPIVKMEVNNESQIIFDDEPAARFAYESPSWRRANPLVCYLTEQYRQDDKDFLDLLLAIRRNTFNDEHLEYISVRKIAPNSAPIGAPKLFSHNADVDRVNDEILSKLSGESKLFAMSSQGIEALISALKRGCLSPETLKLKIGAAVMFTKNSPKDGFVNGTLGVVQGFGQYNSYPIVKARDGRRIEVEPMDWSIGDNGKVSAKITQLPLRLAWAITVHKSQGMSLDEAVMDLSDVFEFGQGYVALSRVRRLSGLHLLGWNNRAFQVHPAVLSQDENFSIASSNAETTFANIQSTELEKMHKNFIMACGGRNVEISAAGTINSQTLNPVLNKKKTDTISETLTLWKEGKTISQIAKTRGLKEQTIFDHIEKLVAKGKIKKNDLSRIISPTLSRSLPQIHATFRELGCSLSPVFEIFDGAHSYEDLKIARMIFEN